MAAANWRFVLTDLAFRHVGEILNAKDRTISLALNKYDSMSFRVRLDNPLADTMISQLGYVKAYRNNVLQAFGPIIAVEEAVDDTGTPTAAVSVAGAAWIMTRRLVGQSGAGTLFTTATDRAEIARQLLVALNIANNTGISTTATVASGSAISYTAGPYRTMYDVLTELSTGYDAFDWRVLPVDNFAKGIVTGQSIGQFVAQPILGGQRDAAIFEWGTGRNNIKSYSRVASRETQANRVVHNASAGPDAPGYPTVFSSDAASIAAYGLMEDLAQGDLSDPTLRQQLTDEHVRLRKLPRTVVKFEPHIDSGSGRLPQFGVDYDVGDWVRARIAYAKKTRIDAWLRVWGVTFSVDDNGVERASTVLAAQDNA